MMRRTGTLLLTLAWTIVVGSAGAAGVTGAAGAAQEGGRSCDRRGASRPARARLSGGPGADHLAGDDPRGDGPPAQRLVAQAGRPPERSSATCPVQIARASRASRSWRSSTPATASTRSSRSMRRQRPGDRPGRPAGDVRRAVWSADGKQLFAGGGFDDLIYRFDHADGLLSKKAVFEYPDRKEFLAEPNPARTSRPRSISERRPAWPSPRTARRSTSPPRSATRSAGSTPSRGRSRARSRSVPTAIPMAWRSTSRAGGSMSASGARPRSPSSTRPRSRSSATWPTAGASQRDAPGARREDPVRGQRQSQHRHGDRHRGRQGRSRRSARPSIPRPPRAARPTRWRSRPMSRCCSSPTPTPTTWRSSTSRSPAAAPRWASSRSAGIRPRCGSPATARRSTWPTARVRPRGPTATARGRASPAPGARRSNTSAASSRGRCR